ncbi:MAG: hypothetical protein LC803_23050 [Acidobacteria bacterium]|nr:hypothetical protein [Acidobacteriota bacterium]
MIHTTASTSGRKPRAAVLKLITPFLGSQPYLIEKKGEAVNYSIKNRFAFQLYKTLFVGFRLRFSINQFERFEILHPMLPASPIYAQF